MDMKQAQAAIATAISNDAERVISAAVIFNPSIVEIVAETRKAPGNISGVAAVACRYALKGADNSETVANMIKFAEAL